MKIFEQNYKISRQILEPIDEYDLSLPKYLRILNFPKYLRDRCDKLIARIDVEKFQNIESEEERNDKIWFTIGDIISETCWFGGLFHLSSLVITSHH